MAPNVPKAPFERQHQRVAVDVAAEVSFGRDDQQEARTFDLSVGGVRLQLHRAVKVIRWRSPLSDRGRHRGRADRAGGDEGGGGLVGEGDDGTWTVGCKFIAVRASEKTALEQFLLKLENR